MQSRQDAAATPEYVPVGQALQLRAPGSEYMPSVQTSHAALPLVEENVPPAHGLHVLAEVAPRTSDAVPARHTSQSVMAGLLPYLPLGQDRQSVESFSPRRAEKVPAAQAMHDVGDDAPTVGR